VITLKELKVRAELNNENKIVSMEPVKKAIGKTADIVILTARLYTEEEIDRETRELMQDNVHTYTRVHSRVRQRQ
jgi:hypothetical protein